VLALSDSRNSVDQNKYVIDQGRTIQKLTYLTIAYLPIGLAAVGLLSSMLMNPANGCPGDILNTKYAECDQGELGLGLVRWNQLYYDVGHLRHCFLPFTDLEIPPRSSWRGWQCKEATWEIPFNDLGFL
jgi:hypothetical protein